METILIATDFSLAARNASEYGVQLANCLKAKVILLHVFGPAVYTADPTVMLMPFDPTEGLKELLKLEADALKLQPNVHIESLLIEGSVTDSILQIAEEFKATWIVAGMKGSGKTMRKLFGSTVFSLRNKTGIPLIIVPEKAVFTVPGAIALASSMNDGSDVSILDPLEEFGLKCNAKMHVVRVIKKDMNEFIERMLRPSRVKWHCSDLYPTFDFVEDADVSHAMNQFVQQNHIDIIAMIAEEHAVFDRVFLKSDIKEVLFSASVPVIVLPMHVKKVAKPVQKHQLV